jgi:hypothetical protein
MLHSGIQNAVYELDAFVVFEMLNVEGNVVSWGIGLS